MKRTPLLSNADVQLVLELSAGSLGFYSAHTDPRVKTLVTVTTASRMQKLVQCGSLHPVKVSHRVVHYFDTLPRADAFRNVRSKVRAPSVTVAASAPWPKNAEPVITPATKFTHGPSPVHRLRTNTFEGQE